MKKEIFSCDKCKNVVENGSDLKGVFIKFDRYHVYAGEFGQYDSYRQEVRLDLCDACSLKLGLVKADAPQARDTPEIKDRLYDVFRELIESFGGNR